MMRRWGKIALLVIFIINLTAVLCLAEENESRILVVETSDIHGYVLDASSCDVPTFQYRMAYIAHLIKEARSSGGYDDLILLDGGDLYQGSPVSNMSDGAVVRAVVDKMSYDAVALGNHEFDWNVTVYGTESDGTIPPYELGKFVGNGKTPVLASNLYDAVSGERVSFTKDYVMLEKAGKRIAVIGYIPDYTETILPERISPYRIDEDLGKLDKLVHHVRETEQPDAVVVLAHEDPVLAAEGMDPEMVDLVCGGHSHMITVKTAENGIPCIQGGCNGKGFSSAVLVFSADGSVRVDDLKYTDILEDKTKLFDTEENQEHLDPEIMEILRTSWDVISDKMNTVLGYIDKDVKKSYKIGTSTGGNWLTSMMLRAAQPQGAIAAFTNTGGIRVEFEIPEGETKRAITVFDILSLSPFGNPLLLYDINGAEIKQQLINGLKKVGYGDQMTGLTFTYTATGNDDMDRAKREYTILSATLSDGTEIDLEDTEVLYRVCVNKYNASIPGNVFEGKTPVIPESDAPIDNETFIRMLYQEGLENDGYLFIDDSPRSFEVEEEVEDLAA